jgi:hypothetical protein
MSPKGDKTTKGGTTTDAYGRVGLPYSQVLGGKLPSAAESGI